MMIRSITAAIVAACLVGAAPRLQAQSMSTLTNAKRVASNAVAATNEHTGKEQMLSGSATTPEKPARTPAVATSPRSRKAPTAKAPVAKHDASAKPAAPARTANPASASSKKPTEPDGTSEKGPGKEITLLRESFSYDVAGRRDPFVSLIESGELRPMISDLRLVTVIYAPAGRSVAIMRDVSTQEQYRVKAGQTLGRMRVARISPKSVTFTIEEYGFSRQEVLALNDTTRARSQ